MKQIGIYLKKRVIKKRVIDNQTIFYLFKKKIKQEYGRKGEGGIIPDFFKDGKLFVVCQNSNWKNELWLNREELVKKINNEIGSQEIKEIKIK